MQKRNITGLLLLLGIGLLLWQPLHTSAAVITVSYPGTQAGWVHFSTRGNSANPANGSCTGCVPAGAVGVATNTYVTGADTPPLGTGSLNHQTGDGSGGGGATGRGGRLWSTIDDLNGVRLADITEISYSTYRAAASPDTALQPTINLYVDLAGDGNAFSFTNGAFPAAPPATNDALLVFEPTYTDNAASLVEGTWQRWTITQSNGLWWDVRNNAATNSPCGSGCRTLGEIAASFPTARVYGSTAAQQAAPISGNTTVGSIYNGFLFASGSPDGVTWANFNGNIDHVRFNVGGASAFDVTYDFESAGYSLVFTQQPTTAATNVTITPSVTVEIRDAGGNLVNTATNNITLVFGTNPSAGTLAGTTTVAAVAGVATFNNLSINNVGTGYTLTASATGITTSTTSASFNINATVQFNAATGSGAEGDAGSAAVTAPQLQVSGGITTAATTVEIVITEGTALFSNNDFTPDPATFPLTVTIPAGNYTTPVLIPLPTTVLSIVGDTNLEADETLNLTLQNPSSGITLGAQTASVYTIQDDDNATVNAFSTATVSEQFASYGQLTVTLSKVNDTSAPITVNYTITGTALEGSDYNTLPRSINIPVGQDTASMTITHLNDTLLESGETIIFTLTTVNNFDVSVNGPPATLSITSEDTATASIVATDDAAAENSANGGLFTVTLSKVNNTSAPITVNYNVTSSTAAAPADYVTLSGSVNVPVGADSATIAVDTTADDNTVEGDETVAVTLGTTSNAQVTATAPTSATVNIADDDTAGITVNTVALTTLDEDDVATTTSFTVAANSSPTSDVTVPLTSDGQCSVPASVVLPAGVKTAQTVTVTAVNDTTSEAATHNCVITTGDPSSADATYNAFGASDVANVTASVLDNDITFTVTNSGAVIEGTGTNPTITYTITPSAAIANVGGSFTYAVAVSAGSATSADFVTDPLPSGTLTFAAGGVAQPVTVVVVADAIAEPNFTLQLTSSAATSGTAGTASTAGLPSDVVVTDDDTAGNLLVIGAPTSLFEGISDTWTLNLSSVPASPVTVAVTVSHSAQCSTSTATVTLDSTNWNSATDNIQLTVTEDLAAESPHVNCTVTYTVTSTGNEYDGLTSSSTITVSDNDTPGITINPTSGSLTEGGNTPYEVRLNTLPAGDVTVTLSTTSSETTFVTVIPLTFTTDTWNIFQPVTLTVAENLVVEGTRTASIVHDIASTTDAAYDALADATYGLTINDNDTAAPSTSNTDSNSGSSTPPTAAAPILRLIGNTTDGSPTILLPGATNVWTYTVENIFGSDLSNLLITITYPDDDMVGINATSSIGVNGTFRRGSLIVEYSLGTLQSGQTVTFNVTTRLPNRTGIFTGTLVPSVASVSQADSATLSVVVVDTLPATGETPWWRPLMFFGALAGVALLLGLQRRLRARTT